MVLPPSFSPRHHLSKLLHKSFSVVFSAARSEVLTEDLQSLEKRVDLVKQVCHTMVKKLQACSLSQSGDFERRLVSVTSCEGRLLLLFVSDKLDMDWFLRCIFYLCQYV